MPRRRPSRRELLAAAGLAPLAPALAGRQAETPRTVPDPARVLEPTGADLGSLFPEVQKLAEAGTYRDSFLTGGYKSHEEFRARARQRVLELLLYRPEKVDPRPEVLERVDRGDHVRERVLFSTSPTLRVPAYVLIPKKLRGKAPGIVDLHSHGGMFLFGKEKVIDLGKNHPVMTGYHQRNYDGQPTATALVRRGYVVISIDAFMFGERRILMDRDLKSGWDRAGYSEEEVQRLNQVCRGKESTLAKALVFAGASWPGIVFWDDMRTVDYLTSRPEVDATRVGCLGISMGGYRAIYLSALDERIKAGCVVGFMSSVKPMIRAHIDTHSWVHFLPGLHRYLDLPDVAGMTAPRALLVQQCTQDRLFPLSGMKESLTRIAAIYQKAGVPDQHVGRFYDAPHQFTRPMQADAFAWLDRHLGHTPG